MTDAEFARMNAGFAEHASSRDDAEPEQERHGLVAIDDGRFIGCSSGLAYRGPAGYGAWFTLTDLFVEAPHRGRGLGRELLARLEAVVAAKGITDILTWTAGYQAPAFYAAMGYTRALTCEGWYPSGADRIAMTKRLSCPSR